MEKFASAKGRRSRAVGCCGEALLVLLLVLELLELLRLLVEGGIEESAQQGRF